MTIIIINSGAVLLYAPVNLDITEQFWTCQTTIAYKNKEIVGDTEK